MAQNDENSWYEAAKQVGIQDTSTQIRNNVQSTISENPDKEAQYRHLARFVQVPIETVRAMPDEIQKQAAVRQVDADAIAQNFPHTARFMSDMENVRLVHDDVPATQAVEQAVKGPKYEAIVTSEEFSKKVQEIKAQNPAMDWDNARYVASQRYKVDNTPGGWQESKGPKPSFSTITSGLWQSLVSGGDTARQGLRYQFADAIGSTEMQADALKQYQRSKNAQFLATPEFESKGAKLLYGGAENVVQNVPIIAAAIATRNPTLGAALGAIQQEAQAYPKYRERGGSAGEAVVGAGIEGAIEYATEKIPLSFLTEKFGKIPLWQLFVGDQAREQITEQIATHTQDLTDALIANPNMTMKQYLEARPDAALQTAVAVLMQGLVIGGAHQAAVKIGGKELDAQQAEQSAAHMEQILKTVQASKLLQRDPQSLQAFVAATKEDGPIQDVWLNPNTLAQSGVDLNALAQAVPSIAPQLQEAMTRGGEIQVALETLATALPGTGLEQTILDHMRTDPDAMTRAEARTFLQTQQEEFQAEAEKLGAQRQAENANEQERQAVFDQMMGELQKANRFTADVNQQYATMLSSFYNAYGTALNQSPQQLAQEFVLHVESKGMQDGARRMEQGASSLDDVRKAWESAGIESAISEGKNGIQLSKIIVPKDERQTGKGTAAMRALLAYADSTGQRVTLTPSSDFGGSKPRLKEFYKRFGFVENKGKNRDFTTRDSLIRPAGNPNILEQPQETQGGENPRGYISFDNVAKDASTITLLKNADLSTFIHESGHFFLEVMANIAARPDAPAMIRDDFNTTLNWFKEGMTPEQWAAMPLEEQRPFHEQFARGFEAYAFEGKAPSVELRAVFQRFRAWLLSVYKSIKSLNVELTDEVRGVFDRMLATEAQIAEMQQIREMGPLLTEKPEGADEATWQEYQTLNLDATEAAVRELETRSLRDMKWLSNAKSRALKELQKDAATKRKAIRDEVIAEVRQEPVYAAMNFLKDGETKLSTADLTEMYGGEGDRFALLDWSSLTRGGKKRIAGTEGVHPDTVAQLHGFTSGDEMVRKMLAAEPEAGVIDGLTDQRMLQRYGDLADPQSIERAAEAAIHNEARARFVATEYKLATKALGSVQVIMAAAKQHAAAIISGKKVRDLKPAQYAAAEARAAKAAHKAMGAADQQQFAAEMRNKVLNNALAREATQTAGEIEKGIRYLKKFDNEGTRRNVDIEYRDQIDQILEGFDLRTGQSLKAIDKRKSYADWVQAQQEMGLEPVVDADTLAEIQKKHFKDLTVEEFRGVIDTVKNIEHLGRLKNKLLTAKDQREFAAVVGAIEGAIRGNAKKVVPEQRTSDRGLLVDAGRLFKGFVADHRKFASRVREFDGWKDGGASWEYLVRNMNDAGNFEAVEREKATIHLGELLKPILKEGKLGKKMYFEDSQKSFTREERLGMALNMGNQVNRERVMSGERLSESQLQNILNTLTPEDWKFVQGVWDYLDTFRPQIAAKERRLTGVEPKWVEAAPVVTKDGQQLRGGYYPIKYDALRSTRAEADVASEVQKQIERGAYTRAQTRKGHLKARTESTGRPLRYDLGVIVEHVDQVVHDLAWHEYLIDANRLVRAGAIDSAVRMHYGPDALRTLRDTLKDIAIGDIGAQTAAERVLNHLRHGATIAGLGWRLSTSLLQPIGLTQSVVRIGGKWVAKGARHWMGDTVTLENSAQKIYEKSDFMRLRGKTMQREINEIRNKVSGKDSMLEASYFYLIQKMQLVADIPTWWGQYEKSMAEDGMTEDRAIALADQAVIDAQGAGQIKDLAQVQRGSPAWKLFTNFYSFFNTTYNLTVEAVGRTEFKRPSSVAMLAVDMALLYSIPALLGTLLKAALGGDWSDEDKLIRKLIADQVNYLMSSMVVLREIGAVTQNVIDPRHGLDYTGPAGVRFFSEVSALAKQVGQGEADEPFWKHLNSTLGILFQYPAGQINQTVDGIAALVSGRSTNPGVLISGAPKK